MADMFKHSEICGADLDSLDVEDLTIINEYYNEKICLREEDKVKLTIGKKKMVVRAINDELEVEKREAAFKKFREPVKEVELQVEVKNVWDVSVALQTFKVRGGGERRTGGAKRRPYTTTEQLLTTFHSSLRSSQCELQVMVRWSIEKIDSHVMEGLNPEAVNWEPANYPKIEIFGQVEEFLERKRTFCVSKEGSKLKVGRARDASELCRRGAMWLLSFLSSHSFALLPRLDSTSSCLSHSSLIALLVHRRLKQCT